ncbi:MAG: glycosyltransferase family 4 protein [Betaproteobacteria bacterium]
MHIAIDCRYVRERPSGIGTYVEALVARLPALAPSDVFLVWAHARAPHPLSRAGNVREAVVPIEPNSLWTILFAGRYASFAGVDVFHGAHNLLPRRLPCPGVVTLHDVLPIEHPDLDRRGFVKDRYYPRAVGCALRHAARIIVTTGATADRLRTLVPGTAPRTRVVPLAAGGEFRPPADPAAARTRAASLVGAGPFVLVVGQHSATKRHEAAVRAFASHVAAPWRLVLVERQTARDPLAALARRLGISDRIVWLPHVSRPDLVMLLQTAAALLQPSVYEGFGLPVVEAMACGCPVVASDLPTLREVIGEAGLLVPVGDVDGFGRAAAALIASPGRREELRERGIARAAAFSWDRCARETLAVYREAAEQPAS